MSINPKDDYEALAKLIYPSIEASGNVYYGQTRKLIIDETLGKNNLGFESHIESVRITDDEADYGYTYTSYFCWRLGSLHSKVRFIPHTDNKDISDFISIRSFPDIDKITRIIYADDKEVVYDTNLVYDQENYFIPIFGTIFAKYKLNITQSITNDKLHSGEYPSYEKHIEPVLIGMYVTDDFNPLNSIDRDIADRHFYISEEDSNYYLYVQIFTSIDTNEDLTLIALTGTKENLDTISLNCSYYSRRFVKYYTIDESGEVGPEKSYTPSDHPTMPSTHLCLLKGRKVAFKSDVRDYVFPNTESQALVISIDSGKFFVYGNCDSLLQNRPKDVIPQNALYRLFANADNLYGTPILPYSTNITLSRSCFANMFKNCTSLSVAPKLKYLNFEDDCCEGMFYGCTSLVSPPEMLFRDQSVNTDACLDMFRECTSLKCSPKLYSTALGGANCYKRMFYDCHNIKSVICNATASTGSATFEWLTNTASNGTLIKKHDSSWPFPDSFIPSSWSIIEENSDFFDNYKPVRNGFCLDKCDFKTDYLVTSGSDSTANGRGYIASGTSSTMYNMEYSFDERDLHPMNEYNQDGSFNQEIWGYKIFNSPVQFRNGIYDENISIIAGDTDKNDEIIPNLSVFTYQTIPTDSFEYISTECFETLPRKCSKVSCKNYSELLIASTSSEEPVQFTTVINDPYNTPHGIDYNIDSYHSAYSELNAKDHECYKEARVYSSVKPSVNLSINQQYFQDLGNGHYSDGYVVSLIDSSFSTVYESGIVADKSFINVTSVDNNSTATVKANKVNIDSDEIKLKNVTILPDDHVNDSEYLECNHGGLYILGISLYSSGAAVSLNCGTVIRCSSGAWRAIPQNVRVSVRRINFSATFSSSFSTEINVTSFANSSAIDFKLLSPVKLTSTNSYSCAFAICTYV